MMNKGLNSFINGVAQEKRLVTEINFNKHD